MAHYTLLVLSLIATLPTYVESYAITGAHGGVNTGTGQRPSRQDLSTFKNSGAAFDLYILSLQQFQQQNQSALLSYYQVAGIHGHPYTSWDGVTGSYQAGYCTHGSILFPSWHRPYLSLFEQIIWTAAQQIAQTYPYAQKARYKAAATNLRIPYWDWALNATMPDPVNDPTISINTPQGVQNIANPLYSYTFHPLPSAPDFPTDDLLSAYNSTARYPDPSGKSQPDLANKQLQANAQAIHDLTYQLIADQSSYAPFSNTAYVDDRGGSYNSLENMHDAIHSLVGQNGHMAYVPFAGFDPIFWLHHTNVDRLFAIWQAIYPDSYTTAQITSEGTFTTAPGETEDVNTPLTPFHADTNNTLYTSATARTTRHFGYTYPEVVEWNVSSTQLSSNVRTNLNKLYNPTDSLSTRSLSHRRPNYHGRPRYSRGSGRSYGHQLGNVTKEFQYFVNVRVDKAALLRPFFVHFFLGSPPSDTSTWSFAPNLIGSNTVLYYPSASNITPNTPRLNYGQLPLTHVLPYDNLTTVEPDSVIPVLREHLSWRVQDFNDNPVPTAELPTLQIFVVSRETISRAGGDRFPVHSGWEIHRDATDGKEGGLNEGEGL